jgi:hypothetical protein
MRSIGFVPFSGLVSLLLAGATALAREPRPQAAAAAQEALPAIEDPKDRITNLADVEDYSEDVANAFVDWSDKIRRRDFAGAAALLTEDFRGHDLSRLGAATPKSFPLSITKTAWEVKSPAVVGRADFLEGVRAFVAPFATIEFFFVKVRGAEFADRTPVEGALTVRINAIGLASGGGRMGREAFGRVHIKKSDGKWQVDRWTITSLNDIARPQSLFTEVARAAGVAHRGPQFGKEGNTSFFWNGAAVGDFDGDGRFDLFVPSQNENFLYHNEGNGTFANVAKECGIDQPPGGTGAVFFDADNDGDVDLLVTEPGFKTASETTGRTTQFWRNDGKGHFTNASAAAGFTDYLAGFSPVVADANGDGWLDVFVCGYQRGGFAAPNSFYDATNGTRNALYVNQGNGTFVDVAPKTDFPKNRWTYAAAWCDYDEDGDQDLFVANDYGSKELWRNDGDLKFVNVADEVGARDVGNGMGCCFGDVDGDGHLDLYCSNMASSAGNRILGRMVKSDSKDAREQTLKKLAAGNTILRWNDGKFTKLDSKFGGVGASWAWSAQFMDIDLDGRLDLACTNGFISGNSLKDT